MLTNVSWGSGNCSVRGAQIKENQPPFLKRRRQGGRVAAECRGLQGGGQLCTMAGDTEIVVECLFKYTYRCVCDIDKYRAPLRPKVPFSLPSKVTCLNPLVQQGGDCPLPI